ncbi:hypothetical protein PRIPAC_78895 [Pristionchus pacificus]|uniref:Uncharacterized protein n=1 Tax=Pristionchus pacificus TaxID=54126 RepID=A0A2A6BVI1_PRIPA|nr:hypothetical protein PRIPAC_78895 [Pristionchus pacificus]|eukprot:PDM69867.1 hypothetical protein PRIPAC_49079 [Pristionchus pacificus]
MESFKFSSSAMNATHNFLKAIEDWRNKNVSLKVQYLLAIIKKTFENDAMRESASHLMMYALSSCFRVMIQSILDNAKATTDTTDLTPSNEVIDILDDDTVIKEDFRLQKYARRKKRVAVDRLALSVIDAIIQKSNQY